MLIVEVIGDGEHFFDGSSEAVQFPKPESVVGSEVVERGDKTGPRTGLDCCSPLVHHGTRHCVSGLLGVSLSPAAIHPDTRRSRRHIALIKIG